MRLFGSRRDAAAGAEHPVTLSIAYACDHEAVNGWYRSVGPMEALAQRGHRVRRLDARALGSGRALDDVDVLQIHRFWDDAAIALVRAAKARDIAVVWDDDDDFTAIPRGLPGRQRFSGLKLQRRSAQVRQMLGAADLVTTTGELLGERLRALGARDVAVLPNFLDERFPRAGRRTGDGVVVGWLAGLEHQFDYERLQLRAVFERILADHVGVRFGSVGLGLGLPADRYSHVRVVPFDDLADALTTFDVGLAPLCDVPFNQARSDIKLKEYAAVGVPWLASPVGAYRALGEQQGGRLVPDDRWPEALDALLRDARGRSQLAKRAQRWGRDQTIGRNAQLWESALREVVVRVRGAAVAS